MMPGRRGVIGLFTLACAGLLAAGLGLDDWWLAPAAGGCGLVAGVLGWIARPAPAAAPAPAAPTPEARPATAEIAPLLRELAEEMVRLKRDSAETSRGMAEAGASAALMARAATSAIARLDESAETSAIAARTLAMLPSIADSHAQRIELMAARAEQALALVPESLAVPPPFEAALARLEGIALPDTNALRQAVERLDNLPGEIGQAMHGGLAEAHDAAAVLLDQAASRIEAARPDPMLAMGLMEATERLDALATPMERARQTAEAVAARMEKTLMLEAGAEVARAERLDAALDRMEAAGALHRQTAITALAEPLARIELALTRLRPDARQAERLESALSGLADPLSRIEAALAEPRHETAPAEPRHEASLAEQLRSECDRLVRLVTDAVASLPVTGEALAAQLALLAKLLEPMSAATAALPPMTESAQRATEALLCAAQANIALAGRAREVAGAEPEPARMPPPELPAGPAPESRTEPPPRPARLRDNLDDTIRGLQSLSSAMAAAAERRLEPAA